MDELRPADVRDVRERAGLEVVYADHAVTAGEEFVTQMRAEEPGAACDQACGHIAGSLDDVRFGPLRAAFIAFFVTSGDSS